MLLYEEALEKIVKQFLCNVHLCDFNWHNLPFSNLSSEQQMNIWKQTVNSDLVQKYPLNYSYQYAFWKHLILCFERNHSEPDGIPDELYETLCELQNKECSESDSCYKHYVIGRTKHVITLEETREFISSGTTGLKTWEGSLVLAEWLVQNPQKINNKRILELGSGIGLAGLVLYKVLSPSYVCLTDCHWKVLELLKKNIKFNLDDTNSASKIRIGNPSENFLRNSSEHSQLNLDDPELRFESNLIDGDIPIETRCISSHKTDDKSIEAMYLPWKDVTKATCEAFGKTDVVIAADIIYDPSLFDELLFAMNNLSKYSQVEEFIFCCTVRNEETLQHFLKLADENGFLVTELSTPEQQNFIWPTRTEVRLYPLKKPVS